MEPVIKLNARVLVVEDDLANRVLLARMLERAGHASASAPDGASALRQAASGTIDLVLLDLGLPDMDGLEVCRRLRREPLTASLPIILVTGRDGREEFVEGAAAGADDWIAKPYGYTTLVATIERVMRRRMRPPGGAMNREPSDPVAGGAADG
jgi:DNA-binding response OmpR family regulator